jgi:hypothetical protein
MYSRKIQTIIILSALLLSTFALPSLLVPHAQAAGNLYVDPATMAAAAPGTTVKFTIKVSGVDSFNGWDVSVRSDPTSLTAVSIDKTGSVAAGTVTELVNCVNGIGTGCGINDGDGVVHSAVTFSTPTANPATGTLFTISYTTGFGTGSLVSPFLDVLASAVTPGSSVSHTTSRAVYGTPNPDFTIDTTDAFDQNGNLLQPGSEGFAIITVTSVSGFTDTVNVVLSPSAVFTEFVSPTSFVVPAGGANIASVDVIVPLSTAPGIYHQTVTVSGVGTGLTHAADLAITVLTAQTVSVTCGTDISVVQGTTGVNPVSVTSRNNFFGAVFFSITVSGTNGPTATVKPSSFNLAADRTDNAVLYVTPGTSTPVGTYSVTVNANIGTKTVSCTRNVTVLAAGSPDFTITSSDSSLIAIRGIKYTSTITTTNIAGLTGTVDLTYVLTPLVSRGPTISVGSGKLNFTTGATAQLLTYTATVIGRSGSQTHAVSVIYTLEDFGVSARGQGNAPLFLITATQCNVGKLSIGSLNGFNGVVTITRIRVTGELNTGLAPVGITVTPEFTTFTVTSGSFAAGKITVCTTKDTQGGEYQLQVTGTTIINGVAISHRRNVFIQINSFDVTPSTDYVPIYQGTGSAQVVITLSDPFVGDLTGGAGFGTSAFIGKVSLAVSSPTTSITAVIAPGPYFMCETCTPTALLNITVTGGDGLYTLTVSGTSLDVPALVRTATITVSVATTKLSNPTFTNSGDVAISPITHKGTETFTGTVVNSSTGALYVVITCSGISSTGRTFTAQSAPVLIAAGARQTITFTATFTSLDIGSWNLTCVTTGGPTPDALLLISQDYIQSTFAVR